MAGMLSLSTHAPIVESKNMNINPNTNTNKSTNTNINTTQRRMQSTF